jgi:hypothetical protein
MNYAKKIEELISENELLQLQLGDLEHVIRKKDEEIGLLGEAMESAASLRSRIDSNLIEIEQLKANSEAAAQKNLGSEMLNEELEMSLMKERKEKQKQEAELKGLHSVRTELDIVTGELEESAGLYKKLQETKAELAAAKSRADLLESENAELKAAIEELELLLKELRNQKFS